MFYINDIYYYLLLYMLNEIVKQMCTTLTNLFLLTIEASTVLGLVLNKQQDHR